MRRCICLVAFAFMALNGCGGGGGSSNNGGTKLPIAVSVTPLQASLSLNGSQQYSASVANSANQAVNWSVQEGAGGGTVSTAGMYQAPNNVAGVFHVTATSQADGSKSTSVPVTVHVGITASPPSATLTLGQSQVFTASVIGSANTAVNWSVQEGAAGGTISAAGVYNAPSNGVGTFHVVAVSQADSTQSATAPVTVQAGGANYTIQ